jgi:rhodanese-related sulfurtransferase
MSQQTLVDAERLRAEVRQKYRAVAVEPAAGYHFSTGRGVAARLGYDAAVVDALPQVAVESFAGVANPLALRAPAQFASGHVPGALGLELSEAAALAATLPPGPLTVMCGHGERATNAASILATHGRADVSVLVGGPADVAAARGQRLAV